MLTLKRSSETDAVVTKENHHQGKMKTPKLSRILELRKLHCQRLPLQSYQVLVVKH